MQQLSSAQIQKYKRMTLLVGMVASDGILLAADQARVRPASNDTQMDDKMLGRKITHLEKHQVAFAVAGDELTDTFGVALLDALDAGLEFGGGLERSLEGAIARKIAELQAKDENRYEPMERTAMVAFYGSQVSEPQLWRIRVRASPAASRIDRIAIAGGEGNAARFFGSYYEPNLPIAKLLPLASHIVLMGHRFDSLMVEGLDIATFDSNGFHFLSEKQKAPLREGSRRLDGLTGKRLRLETKDSL